MAALGPVQFHYRVPWFGSIINQTAVTWRGGTADVMKRDLAFARAAAVDFFAFVAYESEPAQCPTVPVNVTVCPLAMAFEQYISSPSFPGVNFTFIIEVDRLASNTSWPWWQQRLGSFLAHPWAEVVQNGSAARPLAFLMGLSALALQTFPGGAKGLQQRLASIAQEGIARGASGPPLWVGLAGDSASLKEVGIDTAGEYAVFGGSKDGEPFSTLATATQAKWEQLRSDGMHVLPPVPLGWDPRPRLLHPPPWLPHGEGSNYFKQGSPQELAALAATAAQWVRKNADVAPAQRGLVYAWNEFSEGGWLSPTLFNGTDRVMAFQKALSKSHRR